MIQVSMQTKIRKAWEQAHQCS